eukprot:PITA_33011
MVDEMAYLHKNEAWDLVELPTGRKPIGSKWVFKKKENAKGKVEKYKAWLVAKGYSQVLGIGFGDIFSLVTKVASIRLLLSIDVAFDFEVEQMDVKTTFLHGDLEEEIYMKKLEGFVLKGKKELVYVKAREGALDSSEAVFRYLCGTSDYGLVCATNQLMSKKQSVVALSTTEAEYMAATHASKEAVWLQRLCSSMGLVQGAIRIDCDSQSAIFLAKNPAYHSKTKHIDVQYHFVRDMIEDKKVLLVKVDTLKNTADALTKSMSSKKLFWCRETMGIVGLDK